MQGSPRIDELRQKFHENPRRYFAPLANEYRKAGDPEQAIAICRAHLAQQPGHMSGHVVYGQALYDARRPDEARTVFEKALSLDPDNAIVLRHLGDIARERGEVTEARHWYSRALDIDSQDTEVAAYLAELEEPVSVTDSAPTAETEEAQTPEAEDVRAADSEESQAAPPTDEVPAKPAEPEVSWRKTPKAEQSPFITRTMAELYAQQGHREAALDVYRQLALQHPDDAAIRERIGELSGEAAPSAEEPVEARAADKPPQPPEPYVVEVSDAAREPAESDALSFAEPGDEAAAAASGPVDREGDAEAVTDPSRHFTEMELSNGDAWDADSWAAGFGPKDSIGLEFVEDAGHAPIQEPVREEEPQEPVAMAPPDEGLHEPVAMAPPDEEAQEPVAVGSPDEPPSATVSEAEAGAGVVAYSPELPPDEELPHFTPKEPTVREFFATLGARRPPSREPQQSFTARGAIPAVPGSPPKDDLPLAADAFANLFPASEVSEEDNRAAFALTGALSATGHTPTPESLRVSAPSPPAEAPLDQESEEDIRRFREWLDGLAES